VSSSGPRRSGFSVRLAIIDYSDRNDDGEPRFYEANQDLTAHELAMMDRTDFIDQVVRTSADAVARALRSDDDPDELGDDE